MKDGIVRIEFRGNEFSDWIRLREKVLREPLGLSYSEEDIAAESKSDHICYLKNGTVVGGLVLQKLPDAQDKGIVYKMRQVAVLPDQRKQGTGSRLVAFAEKFVRERGATKMILHAREEAVPFYVRMNYQKLGEPFEEVGLPHYKMEKQIK